MALHDIQQLRERFFRPDAATLLAEHVPDVYRTVQRHRPTSIVEIGTSTGLTTALLAHMIEEHGGSLAVTVDRNERFYMDHTMPTGFLIPEVYPSGPVRIERHVGCTSLDVASFGHTYDLGLVDGNHLHPWPTIDTMCLYPFLSGPRMLIHDDLNLFTQGQGRRMGAKVLYDQFGDSHRTRFGARGNMFTLDLSMPQAEFEAAMRDSILMRWTTRRSFEPGVLDRFREFVKEHYSPALSTAVDQAIAMYDRFPDRQPQTRIDKSEGAAGRD